MNLKKRCIQLEGKLKRSENESDMQIDELREQNRRMNEEIKKFS